MAVKRAKNLASSRDQYSAYYGDFRGVDFSNDHTRVREDRLAYSVNMYKDYKSKNGAAIETIPGFRRQFSVENGGKVYGIHQNVSEGNVYVHVGKKLYHWKNYPNTAGVELSARVKLGTPGEEFGNHIWLLDVKEIAEANGGGVSDGARIVGISYRSNYDKTECKSTPTNVGNGKYKFTTGATALLEGDYVIVRYVESEAYEVKYANAAGYQSNLELAEAKSTSINIGSSLYIKDGKKFLRIISHGTINHEATNVIDGLSTQPSEIDTYPGSAYIPTRYTGVVVQGENATGGIELEPRNMASKYFKIFYNDAVSMTYPLKEKVNPEGTFVVEVRGKIIPESGWSYSQSTNEITLSIPPDAMTEDGLNPIVDGEPVVRIIAEYDESSVAAKRKRIEESTICEVIGDRVFLAGISINKHLLHYSRRITDTVINTFYFADMDWITAGLESSTQITGIIPVGDSVMVLSNNSTREQNPVYFLTPAATGDDLVPSVYESERGLFTAGCLGACTNFLDDPVFVSKRGVEAMGSLSVRLERAMEHRSTLIDAQLTNTDLSKAFMHEWGGYLFVFVEGKVFMADSRQAYLDTLGIKQYEWYYLEGIGVYEGQAADEYGVMKGGTFKPATCAASDNDDLYFGTENGVVCKFNFDKRDEYGEIPSQWYTFDGRTILSGCATKMDNCGAPHLTKSTVKKSLVIKTKIFTRSALKLKVRTNNDPYKQVTRITNSRFAFDDMDFDLFSFADDESGLFAVREKEKKWVEKQYYLYSDEHTMPFALYYLAFRYIVAGRYKRK